jgi:dethiobiotin synthetase
MAVRLVVSGTDTGVGKTVFSAALADALVASYWKPVQSGLDSETDCEAVARLGGLDASRILPEAYRLSVPASPHLSARIDGVSIDADGLDPPDCDGPLIIEGAGGLLVPLTKRTVFADVFARWGIPVILCARTSLGTINHTLLSIEALRVRDVPIRGVAFIGVENADTQDIIAEMGGVEVLGRLPTLHLLTRGNLRRAFLDGFDAPRLAEAGA